MMNVKRDRMVTWLALGLLSLVFATIRVFPLLAEGPDAGTEAKTNRLEGKSDENVRQEESKEQQGSEGDEAKNLSGPRAGAGRAPAGRGAAFGDDDDRSGFGDALGGAGIGRRGMGLPGGGMMGRGGLAPAGAPSLGGTGMRGPNESRYVTSGKIAVSWSKAGDTLWGYSSVKGRWSKVKIVPPKGGVLPTVGTFVAAVPTDEHVYAFSNQTGRWGVLKGSGVPTVSQDQVLVKAGDEYHIFSDASGQWASQSAAEEQDVPSAGPGGIAPGGVGGMAAGFVGGRGAARRPGAAGAGMVGIGSAPAGVMGAGMGAMGGALSQKSLVDSNGEPISLVDLDRDGELDVLFGVPSNVPHVFLADDEETADSPMERPVTAAAMQHALRTTYQAIEREIAKTATEYRRWRQTRPEDDNRSVEIRARLQRLVQQAFDQRQNAQRLEAEILRQRLKNVDDRLAERERLKDQITARRVQSLLDPALSWEPSEDVKK